jgi:RND family efflux transporter MFP subunit
VASPIDGVIMKRVHGLEGMAITPGMDVIHVTDISTLWLQVEVYEDQLQWLALGSAAKVRFDYFPGESFTGRVRFVEPEVSPTTRTVQLTLEVPNRNGRLRVGMYATVVFEPLVARDAVVVPAQAVIRTGERDIVVLALGNGRFVPREVTLGVQSDGVLQVLSGLDASERVVTSAQFLIDSESNLRAAIDMLMAEHRQGGGP